MYKKRAGTSGISGQLYKTKLVSLVLFKLLHDERFEYFYLASNMDDIGSFDDLCFKAKIKGIDRPVLVFIQAKHKDDDNSFVDFDEATSFHESYLKVKQKFYSSSKAESEDRIFNGKFDEIECVFILYTNAKHNRDSEVEFNSGYASILNDLLATGKGGTQLHCTDKKGEIDAEIILKQDIVSSSKLSSYCKEILHNFVIYAQQSNQNKVEEVLTKQIEDYNYSSNSNSQNLQIRPEVIFLNYHGAVQAWWLLKIKAPYLTKETQIYQDAMNSIIHEPLMSALKNAFNITKFTNIEYTIHALETLQLTRQNDETDYLTLAEKTIIVTDVTTLTTIKVMQYLNYIGINNYTLLDLSYTINLSTDDFCALKIELKNTSKFIIVICEKLQNGVTWYEKYLKEIVRVVVEKKKVVITNSMFVDMVLDAFSSSEKEKTQKEIDDDVIIYEQTSLIDFTQDSQKNIIRNRKVIFQGQQSDLSLVLDDTSSAFIEGPVLNKIIINETIELGDLISDPNYDEISHLYQDRNVEYTDKSQLIPGNVRVTAVDYILGDILPYNLKDEHFDSYLSVNLLEDPNNYIHHVNSSDNSKDPFYIDFHFVCRMSVQDMEQDIVKISFPFSVEDEKTSILTFKKTDVINKIWIVKITLLVRIELLNLWQTEKKTDKYTLNILRKLCDGVVLDDIVRNENCKMCYFTGNSSKEKLMNLFKISNLLWNIDLRSSELQKDFAIADPSKDIEETSSVNPNAKKLSYDNTMQKNYRFCDGATPTSTDASLCDKLDCHNVGTSNGGQKNILDKATIDYGEENSDSNVILYKEETNSSHNEGLDPNITFIDDFNWNRTKIFYSVIPNITVRLYNDESDNVVNEDVEANNDKSAQKTIIALSWHHDSSEVRNNLVYDFQINYHYKHRMDIKSFDDIKNDVVLLTAKAGVGKSTLLTHLSRKKKNLNYNIWIVKINLVNYSGKFRQWQEDKNIVIDTLETLKFLCQIITKNKNASIDLKESCNKIYLESCSGDAWDRFNLNMFLHYYNERKLLMLFDGFDEICPDYKDQVIKLLQVVKHFPQSNKMWITSRPCNSILPDLERHFGSSYMVTYFNINEQSQYLNNFWNKQTIVRNLNDSNIKTRILFISQVMPLITDRTLKVICYDFYKFILTKFDLHELLQKSPELKLYCESIEEEIKCRDVLDITMETKEFLCTPLLLYLSVTYFVNEILTIEEVTFDIIIHFKLFSIITMFEKFIEIKLRKILFEDKCGLNVDIPFIKETCELELQECMKIHKKLGAFAVFGCPLFVKFGKHIRDFIELAPFKFNTEAGKKEFDNAIDRIRVGKERTGLISHVTNNNEPVFIHKTFAEFFAFEYVYDIIKSKELDDESKKRLLYTVLFIIKDDEIKQDCGDMSFWIAAKVLVDVELHKLMVDLCNEWQSVNEYANDIYSVRLSSMSF